MTIVEVSLQSLKSQGIIGFSYDSRMYFRGAVNKIPIFYVYTSVVPEEPVDTRSCPSEVVIGSQACSVLFKLLRFLSE